MSNPSGPPRFVPTLTEVVPPDESPNLIVDAVKLTPHADLEAQIVNRVMQRVELVLERRLREAVGQLILTHTQTLGPRLQEEIETVVRESVSQAIAQELTPTGGA